MAEKLTDEQLRDLLSDEERARDALAFHGQPVDENQAAAVVRLIASIRAEGRAERAKLEVMLIAALNDEKDKVERVLEDKAEIDAWADRAELELAKLEDARWGYAEIATLAEEGLFIWRSKPHNAKWWSRIDGTPIPNDLVSCIAECIATALAGRAALSTGENR
jgi:hypothetical protein